jgi:hypothetical protein
LHKKEANRTANDETWQEEPRWHLDTGCDAEKEVPHHKENENRSDRKGLFSIVVLDHYWHV